MQHRADHPVEMGAGEAEPPPRGSARVPGQHGAWGAAAAFATRLVNWSLKFIYPEVCQLCEREPAVPSDGYVGQNCRARLRFVKPPHCSRCGRPAQGEITGEFVCGTCREDEPHYLRARAAVLSQDVALEVIHRYKYDRHLWFEPFLAGLLCERALPDLGAGRWDSIVPVPLFPAKQRDRGFNQAERLARRLSRAAGIPLNSRCLQRVRPTRSQTLLTREERLENMRRAFRVRPGARVSGLRVVVVDDVFTTGATTDACAQALLAAGATEVCVWTVTRGL